jgi:RNA polymerase sigma-70 factor (ECF subfamily)
VLTDRSDELVARARTGDKIAFGDLVRITYPDSYALALRVLGNEHDARDAVQDAYLRAFRSIKRFRGDAAFSTWLHRITANCANTLLVRRSRQRHSNIEEVSTGDLADYLVDLVVDNNPESRLAQRDQLRVVADALSNLPDRLRSVVVLRDVYDLSHEAIARELGISISATKVRLHRGRRRLHEIVFPAEGSDQATAVPVPDIAGSEVTSDEILDLPSALLQQVGSLAKSEAVQMDMAPDQGRVARVG